MMNIQGYIQKMLQTYQFNLETGSGYPYGLVKKEIPLASRIIAVADSFDAMTSCRPYRVKLSIEDASIQIKKNSGILYDPEIADIFSENIEKAETVVFGRHLTYENKIFDLGKNDIDD